VPSRYLVNICRVVEFTGAHGSMASELVIVLVLLWLLLCSQLNGCRCESLCFMLLLTFFSWGSLKNTSVVALSEGVTPR
jgi:hypothetical protein